jgi:hypothetical protein
VSWIVSDLSAEVKTTRVGQRKGLKGFMNACSCLAPTFFSGSGWTRRYIWHGKHSLVG